MPIKFSPILVEEMKKFLASQPNVEWQGQLVNDGIKDGYWLDELFQQCGYDLELHQLGIGGTRVILSPCFTR